MATYTPEDLISHDLSCPICFEDYDILCRQRAPKLLLCLHTFCFGCAQRLWQPDGTLECSLCRTVHSGVALNELFDNPVILEHLRKLCEEQDLELARRLDTEMRSRASGNSEPTAEVIDLTSPKNQPRILRSHRHIPLGILDTDEEEDDVLESSDLNNSSDGLLYYPGRTAQDDEDDNDDDDDDDEESDNNGHMDDFLHQCIDDVVDAVDDAVQAVEDAVDGIDEAVERIDDEADTDAADDSVVRLDDTAGGIDIAVDVLQAADGEGIQRVSVEVELPFVQEHHQNWDDDDDDGSSSSSDDDGEDGSQEMLVTLPWINDSHSEDSAEEADNDDGGFEFDDCHDDDDDDDDVEEEVEEAEEAEEEEGEEEEEDRWHSASDEVLSPQWVDEDYSMDDDAPDNTSILDWLIL